MVLLRPVRKNFLTGLRLGTYFKAFLAKSHMDFPLATLGGGGGNVFFFKLPTYGQDPSSVVAVWLWQRVEIGGLTAADRQGGGGGKEEEGGEGKNIWRISFTLVELLWLILKMCSTSYTGCSLWGRSTRRVLDLGKWQWKKVEKISRNLPQKGTLL